MTTSRIRLVTRGDDAGMCATVNAAIRDACVHGILRNISVLVPAPAFAEAAQMLSGLQGIAVGLHLDLTAEWEHLRWGPVLPAASVPSLVDEAGHFFQTGQALHAHGARLEEMQAEVRAQLARARAAGLEITYLDEHMGVGWIAGLGEWLDDFCEREGIIYDRALFRQGSLQMLPTGSDDADDPIAGLLASLDAVPPGDYLLVGHPVYVTEEMLQARLPGQPSGREAYHRDGQRRWFMDERVRAYCRARGVEPIRYSDI